MSDLKVERALSRREILTHLGTAGLGATATILLAGCGGTKSVLAGPGGGGSGGGPSIPSSEIRNAFQNIMTDEQGHVAYLISAMTSAGLTPRPEPTFSTARLTAPNQATFIADSDALENTGTGAYLYAVPAANLIASPPTLQAAASIAIVEGRHAGFLNALTNRPLLTDPASGDTTPPNNDAREVPQSPATVYQRALPFTGTIGQGTGFDTNLNGGPAPPADITNSTSLSDILNYALFLEYLERDFYNINVPKFFP